MKQLPVNTATTIEAEERDRRSWRLREKKNTVARNPSSCLTGLPVIKIDHTYRSQDGEVVWERVETWG